MHLRRNQCQRFQECCPLEAKNRLVATVSHETVSMRPPPSPCLNATSIRRSASGLSHSAGPIRRLISWPFLSTSRVAGIGDNDARFGSRAGNAGSVRRPPRSLPARRLPSPATVVSTGLSRIGGPLHGQAPSPQLSGQCKILTLSLPQSGAIAAGQCTAAARVALYSTP